jgi:hypothetical protein
VFVQAVEHVANMRYGSDWERAGESMLLRRLVPLVAPPGRDVEVKKERPVTSLLGSSLITRVLVGAAAAAAIVILVDSGIAAAGSAGNNAAANDPGFAVVFPNGGSGSLSGSPTSIPTLLIIPTPGVTLTAPPARVTTGPTAGGGKPTPIGPPTITVHPTKTSGPGGGGTTTGPTTTPPTQPTTPPPTTQTPPPPPPPLIVTSFSSDGLIVSFTISGPPGLSVDVAIAGAAVTLSGNPYVIGTDGTVSGSGAVVCVNPTDTLSITTTPALDSAAATTDCGP